MASPLRLLIAATNVKRVIWASMSSKMRLAFVVLAMPASAPDWGHAIYKLLHEAGHIEMPDVNGKPAKDVSNRSLPRSYGADFGKQVAGLVRSKGARDDDHINDVLQAAMMKLLEADAFKKKIGTGNEKTLKSAENYIKSACLSVLRDFQKSKKNKNTDSLDGPSGPDDDGDGGNPLLERAVQDAKGLNDLRGALPADEVAEMMKELKAIHQDAPLYVELMMNPPVDENGRELSKTRIIRMLPNLKSKGDAPEATWLATPEKKIKKVLEKYIDVDDLLAGR